MKSVEIMERYPYKGCPSQRAYFVWVKSVLRLEGITPIKARFDDAGNCIICGEAGRCPGWHTPEEVPNA